METLLIVLCTLVFLLAIVVFSPVVIVFDSRNRRVQVRWLSVLEFRMPLPGTPGRKRLSVFNRQIPIRERQPGPEAAGVKREKSARARMRRGKSRAMGRFFMQCLADSSIRRTLARQLSRLVRRIFRSVRLSRLGSDVSLPDPALNGMLAGALAACNQGSSSEFRVNFTGENSLFFELHFHPHRVLKAFLFSLPGLPYRAVFRQWRAFSAARPH